MEIQNRWYVYILSCQDTSFYVGATNNLQRRLQEHQSGIGSKYVRAKKFSALLYFEEFENKFDAYKRERQIKGFSRQKKLKLIELNRVWQSPIAQW